MQKYKHKHRGQSIWLLYFETPYFQTFPESPKHQKRYQITSNLYETHFKLAQTKQHNPFTNARFRNNFVTNYGKRQQKHKQTLQNTRKTKKRNKNTANNFFFIWLLYFETPYFQTFPDTPKRQKRY